MRYELEKAGYQVDAKVVDDETSFVLALIHFFPDIILADYSLPSFSGLDALLIVREKSPTTPFIFVTGAVGEEIAAETIINGASGFVLKSNLPKLSLIVKKIFQQQGEWQSHRVKHTNRRIQTRVEANTKALDRIRDFLEAKKKSTAGKSSTHEAIQRLKDDHNHKTSSSEEE